MGDLFTSFDESWSYFLERTEPLENFFDQFPDDETVHWEGWLVEPPAHVKLAASHVQEELAGIPWLRPVPDHFLHVWIGLSHRIGEAWERWAAIEPFSIAYERLNCFHSAVVVEVEGPLRRFVEGTPNDLPTFLPHLTVAVAREPAPADELRSVLRPLRGSHLGEQLVRETKRVRFPAARTTVYQPWQVLQTVLLR